MNDAARADDTGSGMADNVTDQIKGLINADLDAAQDDGPAMGSEAQTADDGEPDSGPGVLDGQQSDEPASVDDAGEVAAETDPDDAPVTDEDDSPVDLAYLAEQLDVDKADLYEIEVPLGAGESVTLGEMKDAFREYGPVKEAKAALADDRDKYQKDMLTTRHQINAMMAAANTPDKQRLLRDMMDAAGPLQSQYERQQQVLLEQSIPEWKESAAMAADMDSIVELGSEYAFSKAEITYTKDARTLRMLRDHARARAKLAEYEAAAKRIHAKPNVPGKQKTARLTKRRLAQKFGQAKASPTLSGKTDFVRSIIEKG